MVTNLRVTSRGSVWSPAMFELTLGEEIWLMLVQPTPTGHYLPTRWREPVTYLSMVKGSAPEALFRMFLRNYETRLDNVPHYLQETRTAFTEFLGRFVAIHIGEKLYAQTTSTIHSATLHGGNGTDLHSSLPRTTPAGSGNS